jgi:hypothetical protein
MSQIKQLKQELKEQQSNFSYQEEQIYQQQLKIEDLQAIKNEYHI